MHKESSDGIIIRFDEEFLGFSIVFDDDGRVAYGYLLKDDHIVSDVWLYNHNEPSEKPEWQDSNLMPFVNPRGYASPSILLPANSEEEVSIQWNYEKGMLTEAIILLRGRIIGKLRPGIKPGWSLMALKDGSLAKVLLGQE